MEIGTGFRRVYERVKEDGKEYRDSFVHSILFFSHVYSLVSRNKPLFESKEGIFYAHDLGARAQIKSIPTTYTGRDIYTGDLGCVEHVYTLLRDVETETLVEMIKDLDIYKISYPGLMSDQGIRGNALRVNLAKRLFSIKK